MLKILLRLLRWFVELLMPLEKQILNLPLAKGMDAGHGDPQTTQGMLLVKNARLDREGALSKRTGTVAMTGTYTETRMGTLKGRPFLYGEDFLLHDDATATGGQFTEVDTTQHPVTSDWAIKSIDTTTDIDGREFVEICIADSDTYVYTYRSRDGLRQCEVRDRNTNRLIATKTSATASVGIAKCFLLSGWVYVLYPIVSTAMEMQCFQVGATSWGTTRTLSAVTGWAGILGAYTDATLKTYEHWDADAISTTKIGMAFRKTATNNMMVGWISVSTDDAPGGSFLTEATGPPYPLGAISVCKFDTDEYHVSWVNTNDGDLMGAVYTTANPPATAGIARIVALNAPTATSYVEQLTSIAHVAGTSVRVYFNEANARDISPTAASTVNIAGRKLWGEVFLPTNADPGTFYSFATHCTLWTRPFKDSSGNVYHGVYMTDHMGDVDAAGGVGEGTQRGVQHLNVIIRDPLIAGVGRPVGKLFEGTAAPTTSPAKATAPNTFHHFQHQPVVPLADGTNSWLMAGAQRFDPSVSGSSSGSSGIATKRVRWTVGLANSQADDLQDVALLPGAMPTIHDGTQLSENGFLMYPSHIGCVVADTGGTLVAGDYALAALYKFYDASGREYQSVLSPVKTVTVTTGSTGSITAIVVPAPGITWLQSSVGWWRFKIELYASAKVNGSTLLLIETKVPTNYVQNTVSFTSLTAPWTTGAAGQLPSPSNPQEYTFGGQVLDHVGPPPYRVSTEWNNRHFVVPMERDDRQIRYSKEFMDAEGVAYNELLTVAVPPEGGAIIALAGMYDRLYIFKADRIYAINGSGLDERGVGQGYSDPFMVSETIGCKNPASVVKTPGGIMFLSRNSIYALDRQGQLSPVGRPVRFYTDSGTISSANVVSTRNQVVFTFTAATSTAEALVFDYLHGAWTVYTGYLCADAVVANNILYLQSGSSVWAEDTSYTDGSGLDYSMTLETGHLPLSGTVTGFARLYKIMVTGYAIGANNLRAQVQYDMDPVWHPAQVYDAVAGLGQYYSHTAHYDGGDLTNAAADKAMIVELALPRQKCTSIRVRITDEAPGAVVTSGVDDYPYQWGGASWARSKVDPAVGDTIYAVRVVSPHEIWIAGNNGECLSFDGAAWTDHSVPGPAAVDVLCIGQDYLGGILLGYDTSAYIMRYYNGVWTQHTFPATTKVTQLFTLPNGVLIACCTNGIIYTWDPVALSFTASTTTAIQASTEETLQIQGVWGTNLNNLYVCGASVLTGSDVDGILRWNGSSWEDEFGDGFTSRYLGISGHASDAGVIDSIVVVGETNSTVNIIRSADGTTWTKSGFTIPDADATLRAVHVVSASLMWAVGDGGVIYKSTDSIVWTDQTTGAAAYYAIHGIGTTFTLSGERIALTGLSFEVGIKKGLKRLGAKRNF